MHRRNRAGAQPVPAPSDRGGPAVPARTLRRHAHGGTGRGAVAGIDARGVPGRPVRAAAPALAAVLSASRSEEHTSELQSLMRISYAVFCLKKKKITRKSTTNNDRTRML